MMYSPEEDLMNQFYKQFQGAMDEYMFLAMTEDCHPLIDRCEQIICAAHNASYEDYCNGEHPDEDHLRMLSHNLCTQIMTKMLREFAEKY